MTFKDYFTKKKTPSETVWLETINDTKSFIKNGTVIGMRNLRSEFSY